jgi:hypothetical protein
MHAVTELTGSNDREEQSIPSKGGEEKNGCREGLFRSNGTWTQLPSTSELTNSLPQTTTDPILQATLEHTSTQLNQLLLHINPADNGDHGHTLLIESPCPPSLCCHPTSTSPPQSSALLDPTSPATLFTCSPLNDINATVAPPAQVNRAIIPNTDAIPTRTITLGDKTEITFTAADVRAPPIITFVHDIAGLNCMWDDTTSNWDGVSPLIINGRPIPLVYWRDIYKSSRKRGEHWKEGQWRGTKGKWFKWRVSYTLSISALTDSVVFQVVVHRYRQGTPEEFWKEFTRDGVRMNFTRIVAELAQQRVAVDDVLARQATTEYGSSFPSLFSYRKGGVSHVMSKPADIAKRYRQLKGSVESDDED